MVTSQSSRGNLVLATFGKAAITKVPPARAEGKVPPAKVMVLGGGVAGLAAIQTAKNMGAVVKAYDVRPAAKEQVESMGGTFLKVDYEEDGRGAGGYAKEMSDEYKKHEAGECVGLSSRRRRRRRRQSSSSPILH